MFKAGSATVIAAARSDLPDDISADEFVHADLTTASGVAAPAKAALERIDGVDITTHVVGGSNSLGGGFAALDDEASNDELNLNLMTAVRLDRVLVPHLIQ